MGRVSSPGQNVNRQLFVMERYCVHCAVRTDNKLELMLTVLFRGLRKAKFINCAKMQ